MNNDKKHILLIEPYYGGSHKAFLDGMQEHLDLAFTLLTLPARKWKMRMQTAAPWMAEQAARLYRQGTVFDAILCSTFLDVAVLRSLLAAKGIKVPVAVYFHENQFAYPGRIRDPSFFQFTNINWTTGLTADRLFFNSLFNFESFLSGIQLFLKKVTDVDLDFCLDLIRQKSSVLYPGIDFSAIDLHFSVAGRNDTPVIVWNHRWEHDKDPETFFSALLELQKEHVDFNVIVLGQHFDRRPKIFSLAEEQLRRDNRIIHFGYVQSRDQYARLLCRGDLVVSTALHEFFGISMLEGVRAGCRPLVPDDLSYPELYPEKFRYNRGALVGQLRQALAATTTNRREEYHRLAKPFSWPQVAAAYQHRLLELCPQENR
ncbi:MAG TPA: DUF3524 domain-containing protein [Desulfobulbus sp.]|nr:DUF3524 domain-containing protein [Desulfobulbus sp.]